MKYNDAGEMTAWQCWASHDTLEVNHGVGTCAAAAFLQWELSSVPKLWLGGITRVPPGCLLMALLQSQASCEPTAWQAADENTGIWVLWHRCVT